MKAPKVLVAFSDPEQCNKISGLVARCGFQPIVANSLREITAALTHQRLSVVFCGSDLPDGTFRDVLQEVHRTIRVPVVLGSRTGDWEECCRALHHGAFDFVATPCREAEVRHILSLVPWTLSAA